jgi:putative Ca2+/H+ antiporter (TMEM165/GDT1 family)
LNCGFFESKADIFLYQSGRTFFAEMGDSTAIAVSLLDGRKIIFIAMFVL